MSILWNLALIFHYIQCSYSQMQTSESPNFYGVPFFETSESIRTISSLIGINFDATNKTGEYRIFGLRSSSNIKIDICAPTAKCLNQSGTIELCYFFQNASEDMVHSCDPHFCSIVFGYIGINNTHSNITVSTNDKGISNTLSSSTCISGYLTSIKNKNVFQITAMGFPSVLACGMGSIQFKNTTTNTNQLQTAIYLRKASLNCSPTVKIIDIVDEYVKAPTTTTTTIPSTTPTTTTTVISTTAYNVRNWIHTYWWGPILSALILITVTLFLCVVSCIFQSRSTVRVNKLYRRVLIRRQERKKEMEKLKKEEKQEVKPITEEAFLADTVNIIDEVMLKPDSSNLNEPEKIEPKKVENDVTLNVTSVIPPWKVPWKNEQQIEEDGGGLNENVGATGTIYAVEGKPVDKKEEPSDEDWLQLDNHSVYNSAKESDYKKLSKELSINCEVNAAPTIAPAAVEERAVDLENLP